MNYTQAKDLCVSLTGHIKKTSNKFEVFFFENLKNIF
jgi:hypothetical protein